MKNHIPSCFCFFKGKIGYRWQPLSKQKNTGRLELPRYTAEGITDKDWITMYTRCGLGLFHMKPHLH